MRPAILWILISVLAACQSSGNPRDERVTRTLTNVGDPDRVFTRPVSEVVPELQQAALSSERGRVGNELVFWGYDLPAGERRWLYACAVLPNIDCEARAALVCPAGPQTVLVQREEPGAVRRMNCGPVGLAAPGELRPHCTDYTETRPVMLGVLSCGQ
jgi:hypothetical protein